MEHELLDLISKNGGVITQCLIGYINWTIKGFSHKFDDLVKSVNELTSSMKVSFLKHEVQEERVKSLEIETVKLRERYHSLVNENVTKIELNEQRIEEIEARLNGERT